MVTRRRFLGGMAALAALSARPAFGSVARAVSFGELLAASHHVVVGTAVDSFARWEKIGRRNCIVTYSVFQVEQALDRRNVDAPELMVKTLGGTVGDLGQTFYGEAVVGLHERATVFLRASTTTPDHFVVTAMAQGHYAVLPDERQVHRLKAAFDAVSLIDVPDGAMRRLHGLRVNDVEGLIARELHRAAH